MSYRMSLSEIASRLESLSETVTIGSRTLLGLDTNPISGDHTHITKVDPETEKRVPVCFLLYLSHTSTVSVGGSRSVTDTNTEETLELVRSADVTVLHEPSAAYHVTEQTREQMDFLAIPEVLNGDSTALVGTLGEGIEYVREELGPRMVGEKLGIPMDGKIGDRIAGFAAGYLLQTAVFEAYIIMNTDSAAAREANVTEEDLLTPQEAKERALAAEYHLESEVIYLEYSGTFGGQEAIEILEQVDEGVTWSQIWYGGGLDNRENVEAVLDAGADAVVVGNVFHDIAELEADLCAQAVEKFDADAEREAIREWVAETIDIEEASATRYLSTIPDVPDPQDRALEYLATSVETVLSLDAIAADLDEPDRAAIRQALQENPVPGEAALARETEGDASEVARTVAAALLCDRFDLREEEGALADHLAVEL
jgi:phosphoglycerol geranylgeranyltransferase